MRRLAFFVFLTLVSMQICSQTEIGKDSVKISTPENHQPDLNPLESPSELGADATNQNTDIPPSIRYGTNYLNLPKLDFYQGPPIERIESRNPYANDYSQGGIIPLDNRTWISGGGSQSTLVTYGRIRTGTAILNHRVNEKLILSAGPTIEKYEINGLQSSKVSIGGQLNYAISDKLDLAVFGQYSSYQNSNVGSLTPRFFPEDPSRRTSRGLDATGSAGAQLTFRATDWLTIAGGPYGTQYKFIGNTMNDYGVNGKMSFQVHERIKFNTFGQKSFRGKNSSIGPHGMYPQDNYGGSMEFRISENFGIEAGMVRELNPWTGKWENKPFINPVFYAK